VGIAFAQFMREGNAVPAPGHYDVCEQQIELLSVFDIRHCSVTIVGDGHAVAEPFKYGGAKLTNWSAVLYQQNMLVSGWDRLCVRFLFLCGVPRILGARQIEANRRADPDFAVDVHAPTKLLHGSKNHAQAKPTAGAGRLGGEERLEDAA